MTKTDLEEIKQRLLKQEFNLQTAKDIDVLLTVARGALRSKNGSGNFVCPHGCGCADAHKCNCHR